MVQILLIALISLLAQLILPWWSLAVVAFAVCYWRGSDSGRAFIVGFVGVALVWLVYAFGIHVQTDGIFTGRMGQLLFKSNNVVIPVVATTLIGGLVGGLAGMSGYLVRRVGGNQPANRIP